MPRKIFVTTALPYANGPFHIGHIMEYIQADIWVRFQRMQGHELFFVGADDAHGAPIMLKAEAEGITPQQLVARIGAERPRYLRGFHLSFDHWWSTESPENTELSQEIYRRLQAAGLIYRKSVQQFYDPVKGMFLPDRYIKGECPNCHSKDQNGDSCEVCGTVYAPTELINPYSALSGAKPELRSSEHFFFRLSDPKCVAVPERLAGRTGAPAAGRWPTRRASGSSGSGEQALADWDISRDAPYFGIPIPDAPGKYFYVWLDAPIGYLAALKHYFESGGPRDRGERRSFEEFLGAPDTEQIHFIGKDIIYFHTLFWPAMLKFAGAPFRVPDHVYVHGFITVSGEKMSKSRGTGISPLRYLEVGMNAEWLRYYIAAKLNGNVEDLDFNPEDFIAARQQRPHRQVRQHRLARRDLHQSPVRRSPAVQRRHRRAHRGRARTGRTRAGVLRGARVRPRASARSWPTPTASTRTSTPTSPGCSPRTPPRPRSFRTSARARSTASRCSRCCWPRCCRRSRGARRAELFGLDADFTWPDAQVLPGSVKPYKHLMTRVDAKQLDALFDAPAAPAPGKAPAASGQRCGPDLDRGVQAHRAARGAHRARRAGGRLGQAPEADARSGLEPSAPCSPASRTPTNRRSSSAASRSWSPTWRRAR